MSMLPFDNHQIKVLTDWIDASERIVIVSHVNADGDAIGSLLGWRHALSNYGKQCTTILPTGCPQQFAWLPKSEEILDGESQHDECLNIIEASDLIIGVDFNSFTRTDSLCETLEAQICHKALIDHHRDPQTDKFDIVFSYDGLSSCCELCTWLLPKLLGESAIDQTTARCLYTGISTDTGGFSYSCEESSVFEAAAYLATFNIGTAEIHNNICNTFSIERMLFYGFAISQRLRIFPEKRFAYFYFSLKDKEDHGITNSDMEGLVNYTLMMKDISVGALLREERDCVRVSLRSKDDVNVCTIMQENFDGGGHVKASGGTSYDSLEKTIKKIEKIFL